MSRLKFLAWQYGEERWREVTRLFVAKAPCSLFEAFMGEVTGLRKLGGRHDFTSLCIGEAAHPSERPFVAALQDPAQRYEALLALAMLHDLIPEPMKRFAVELAADPERFFGTPLRNLSDREREVATRLLPIATLPHAAEQGEPAPPFVFISYSTRDKAAVARIRSVLGQNGIRVWLDSGDLKPGDVIIKRIEKGFAALSYFLPILSPDYRRSSWTQIEDNLAWQREVEEGRVIVVPVLLRGDARSLPVRYRQRRFVDLRGDFDAGITELLAFLRTPTDLPAVRINPVDGSELILIKAGRFKSGSDDEPRNPPKEWELPDFYLARYPVTNAQYRKYVEANPKVAPPGSWRDEQFNQPQQPVVTVNWEGARAYCEWAGLRLPSEWEWERAARGTDGRPYPWGKARPTKTLANYGMNVGQPTPVGSYPKGATPDGLFDMAGNVWQWTASLYKDGEDRRTVRGGSFDDDAQLLRAAVRLAVAPDPRAHFLGFRCAQDPERQVSGVRDRVSGKA